MQIAKNPCTNWQQIANSICTERQDNFTFAAPASRRHSHSRTRTASPRPLVRNAQRRKRFPSQGILRFTLAYIYNISRGCFSQKRNQECPGCHRSGFNQIHEFQGLASKTPSIFRDVQPKMLPWSICANWKPSNI